MARRISEEYHTLAAKVAKLRNNTTTYDAYTAAALVKVERALESMSPEPAKGFNAIGFLGCLVGMNKNS